MEAMTATQPYSPLTHFARKLQQHQAAQSALQQLHQNHTKLQYNILCAAIWFAEAQHGRMKRLHFQSLEAALQPWHEYVLEALEGLYQQLCRKTNSKAFALCQWVSDEVTQAQEIEQTFLYQALGTPKKYYRSANQQLLDACYNIAQYFRWQKLSMSPEDREWLVVLLHQVFPNNAFEAIKQYLLDAMERARVDQSRHEQLKLV